MQLKGRRDAAHNLVTIADNGIMQAPIVAIMERKYNRKISTYYQKLTGKLRRPVEKAAALVAEYENIMESMANAKDLDLSGSYKKKAKRLSVISSELTRFVSFRETSETRVLTCQRALSNKLREKMQYYRIGATRVDEVFARAELPDLAEEQDAYNRYVAMHSQLYEKIEHIQEQRQIVFGKDENRVYQRLGQAREEVDAKVSREKEIRAEEEKERQAARQRQREERQKKQEQRQRRQSAQYDTLLHILNEEMEDAS